MGVTSILTVVTPAGSYDLTDLATVKDELGITDTSRDTTLQRILTQVSAETAQYCNRVFPVETIQELIYPDQDAYPYQIAGGVSKVQLQRWPIVSVASVIVNTSAVGTTTLVQDTDFKIDALRGQLIRLDPNLLYPMPWEDIPAAIQYSAGYATIPPDLVSAVLRWVTMRWSAKSRDPLLKAQDQNGIGRQEYWVGGPPSVGGVPTEIASVLDNYRVPTMS